MLNRERERIGRQYWRRVRFGGEDDDVEDDEDGLEKANVKSGTVFFFETGTVLPIRSYESKRERVTWLVVLIGFWWIWV